MIFCDKESLLKTIISIGICHLGTTTAHNTVAHPCEWKSFENPSSHSKIEDLEDGS
jgi:hypothetical protein